MSASSNSRPASAKTGDFASGAYARLDAASRLYGRSRENHALHAALKRAVAGNAELIVLAGPAGIGKTSLVTHLQPLIAQQRGFFIAGKFDQLQRDVPFSAVVAALNDLVRQLLQQDEGQKRAWRDAILTAVGTNGRVITEVAPALERIIGTQPALPALEPSESQNRFNLVFKNFLQVFCRDSRPLVVFLDDVQWADTATLRMLTQLLASEGTQSLLVITSCRDSEIPATHPFRLAVKELERRCVPVETVALAPLGWSDIVLLLGDALGVEPGAAAPLATTLREKTGGNPFFIRQFLMKLHADGFIVLETATEKCSFDLTAIRSAVITENVADLIAQKLERLDPETRRVISYGAAIGNRFELATLASVAQMSTERARELLEPALRDHLVQQIENADPARTPLCFIFQHDRVQHAAYALVAESSRPQLNLSIGRALLAAAGNDMTGALFEIVTHMNLGSALIDSRAERIRLAKLNLLAATRARNSTAYDLATRACTSAIELLGWDAWDENYALAFEAHLRLAECQALLADFEGACRTIDAAVPHVRANADIGRLQTARTHAFLSMGDMSGAVACGRQAAQLLGVELPESADVIRAQLQSEIGAIIAWSNDHRIEELLELPPMTDPERTVLMSLLMNCIPAAYQINPELFALICCKMVSLSIEHGNCPMSAKGYGSFAVILSGIVGNLRDGDRFGKLGVDLCARLEDVTVRSACHFTWAAFASAWVRPIDESIAQYREGIRWGLASGDHPHAAYCGSRELTHLMFRGLPLAKAREAADDAIKLGGRVGDVANHTLLQSRRRFIDWLRDADAPATLDRDDFSERKMLIDLNATGASKSMLSHFEALRVMQRYLAGAHADAWQISRVSDELLPFSTGMLTIAEHVFYQSLACTALWNSAADTERAEFNARLLQHLATLDNWAASSAYNFEGMRSLVRAEYARITGDTAAAAEHFERAIGAAAASDFVHIEALACELAMKFWEAQDANRAAALRARALAAYSSWGAARKLRELR